MFSRALNVCPDIFLNVVKRFDKKDKVSLKFMASQTVKQIIEIKILPIISRSKENHPKKYGQLIQCHIRNIIFQ